MPSRSWPVRSLVTIALLAITVCRADAVGCPGDCNEDGMVTVGEVVIGMGITLGVQRLASCPAMDRDASDSVTVDEVLLAVGALLNGCPAG